MNLHLADDLFSHPETHAPDATVASPQSEPSWTNLFQEPPAMPRAAAEN